MRLTVFNGSPRGEESNTRVLLDHFLNGFTAAEVNTYELAYLVHAEERESFVNLFREAERVLMAFPLYIGAMPAVVKDFIESLEPLCGRKGNPDIGFIVQSGFPEAIQCRHVEHYLEKLAVRLGCGYIGTVIRGGGEAIRAMPAWFNKRFLQSFYELGKAFGETEAFDKQIVPDLAKPEMFSRFRFLVFKLMAQNLYWNPMLKKNKAFEQRFAKPYAGKVTS